MRGPLVIVLAVLALILWVSEARSAPRDPRLAGVGDFAFALGSDVGSDAEVARLAPYDLAVVDGELTPAGRVAQLRATGAIVLGYLSVGTIEPFRSWYGLLRPYRLRDRFEEFDEFYARASERGYRRVIAGRVAPKLLRKGFDGLFLDNTDMIETHPKQRRGMRKLVRRLARRVHGRHGLLFAQNGEDSVGPLLSSLDGWNREDVTWTYDFERRRYAHRSADEVTAARAALSRIGAAGLLVTATDYTAAGDAAAEQESVANACAAGAIPFVADIGLRRLPPAPLRCGPAWSPRGARIGRAHRRLGAGAEARPKMILWSEIERAGPPAAITAGGRPESPIRAQRSARSPSGWWTVPTRSAISSPSSRSCCVRPASPPPGT